MSSFPFIPQFSNSVSLLPHNHTKVPFHCISLSSKSSWIVCSSLSTNGGDSAEERIAECEGQDARTKSSEPILQSGLVIKAPTAPWMNAPLLVKQNEIMDFRSSRTKKDSAFRRNQEHPDIGLTGKVGGGRGKAAMKQIFKGIQKLQGTGNLEEVQKRPENVQYEFKPGDLWEDGYYERNVELEGTSEETREILMRSEFDIPGVGTENEGKVKQWPWEMEDKMVAKRIKKEKIVTAAELSLDEVLLDRLKREAARIKKWVKVKKAGVTRAVVNEIRSIWRDSELALVNFDIPLSRNMHRAREIIEMKTGGLVVWRNRDFLAVYRGYNYRAGSNSFVNMQHYYSIGYRKIASSTMNNPNATCVNESNLDDKRCEKGFLWENLHTTSLYEREADRLLDGLGPRYVDWWMRKPLPVDADLLTETIPGYKTPFRLCPPFTKSKLTDAELTYLRKLAHPLPTHFVLGRNWKLQGLAAAIIKLWEKCHIVKIALKWGIPNTDNEQMANELKKLTGGVLLLRNKFLIVLYRGKDFLPSEVAKLVIQREMDLTECQLQEESARLEASKGFPILDEHSPIPRIVGTLSEFHSVLSESQNVEGKTKAEVQLEVQREKLEKELKDQEWKLFVLKKKMEKSARILKKLKSSSKFSKKDPDLEMISEEERVCLRQMGLKIDSSLVLGRRGVYDGVMEGIHQHWKHREVVKVVTMQERFSQVMHTAKSLEAESGGILVSVVKLKEGHAIILYRGKNYRRPKIAAPDLLNKREALSRSLEIQRFGSLKFFANQREQAINDLRNKLAKLFEKGELTVKDDN